MSDVSRYVVVLSLCTLMLMFAMWETAHIGAGATGRILAERQTEAWFAGEGNDLLVAETYLKAAGAYSPNDPVIFSMWALFQELQGEYGQALAKYQRSALVRPADARTWASILLMKSRLNEFDEGFQIALEKSVRLGPFEPSVQYILVSSSLPNWNLLRQDHRRQVLDIAVFGMKSSAVGQLAKMSKLLHSYDFALNVCARLPRDEKYSRLCKLK